MVHTKICTIYGVVYCSPEEIAEFENGQEILKECTGMDKIPVRLLRFFNDHDEVYFMLLAGEGALYPWKRMQRVNTTFVSALTSKIIYLRDMKDKGIDNSKYQNFNLYDTIIPIERGNIFPENNAKEFKGLVSYDYFKGLADKFYENKYTNI